MIYARPSYYKEFVCVADRCEDTCCAGWQIVIDEKTLARYRKEKGSFGRRLRESIDWEKRVFYQSEEGRCAFLDERNLCILYKELGQEGFCATCRNYPRHIEEFENVREYMLSISCPEAARIILNWREPVYFEETEEEEKSEEYEDFDFFLFSALSDGREFMREILQTREKDLFFRCALVWKLAEEIQRCIEEERIFFCEQLFLRYKEPAYINKLEGEIRSWLKENEIRYILSEKWYKYLYKLELLEESWFWLLKESEDILYGEGKDGYIKLHKRFFRWLEKNMEEWEIIWEQLSVYFIDTYFCGAVYDGEAAGKIRLSFVSVFLIWELLTARWKKNGEDLNMEDIILIVYRYSRELEHSDYNLEKLEELVKK